MRHTLLLTISCLALATPGAIAAAQSEATTPAAGDPILGRWRIQRASNAPWVRQARLASTSRRWVGQNVTFSPNRVDGPGALRCGGARYKPTSMSAEGLFRSQLTAPIADAVTLGIVTSPVLGTRLSCNTGTFDLHRVDETTVLVALDDVIYTLTRASGALAPDTAPGGVVERLLEFHFAGSKTFDMERLAAHAPWLTPMLREHLGDYVGRPRDPSKLPAYNGDPFTDSPEYPPRFAVWLGTVRGDIAIVPVRFSWGRRTTTVEYQLRRDRGRWAVSDLRYQRRGTLGQRLKVSTPT